MITKYLKNTQLYKVMFRIAWPIALQSLITVGVNLMDTVMLSQMGDAQLSASSLGGNYFSLIMVMCMGLGMGTSVMTARYYGMGDNHSLKQTVTIMLRAAIVLCLLFTVVTALFPFAVMHIYTQEEQVVSYGVTYLQWILPTFLMTAFTTPLTTVLRSVNLVKVPLISAIIAFFTNIFFNWIFIFGKLGAPRMEIAGAALGTSIARACEFLIIAGYFFFIDKRIGYRIKDLFMRVKGLVKEYIKVSFPVLVSDTLLTFGNNALAIVMGHIGSTFVAANSVSAVVLQLATIFGQAVANSSGIITGQTLGRGEVEKAKFDAYTFVIIGIIIGLFAGIIVFAIRGPVVNYYNISAEAREIANQMLIAISILIIFQIMNSILTKGVLRAGGDTRFLMAGDILFLWILSIPLGALAGLVWHWPAFWVFFMLKIDQIVKCIWCLFRLKSGKWVKYIRQSEDVVSKQKAQQG